MAGKLLSLEEAANMLGVSPAELSEMRQRGEAYGMRDGSTWKFRQEDVEKLIADRASGSSLPIDLGGSSLDLPVDLSGSQSEIVLSEPNLGESPSGGSTVIGGKKSPGSDDDIELKLGSGLNLLDVGLSGPELSSSSSTSNSESASGISLASGSGLDLLGSDVKLAPSTSGIGTNKPDSSNVLAGGSGLGGSDAGKTMLTAELADKPQASGIKLTMRDAESVFENPDSDLTRNIQGSGINLLDAGDSGLALDDLQLAPSTSGIGKKKKPGASDLELKGDDDFLLTPLEEQTEDSTDSGSQVIALEGEFGDDATATLMAGDVPGLGAMLEADGLSPLASGAPAGGMGMPIYVPPPEPSYGIGTVAALGISSVLMTCVGIMMYDIIRNMWSWDTPYSFSSTLMDAILKMI
jgi:excisionase family DNA binding protein